jgi:hypothetical protein
MRRIAQVLFTMLFAVSPLVAEVAQNEFSSGWLLNPQTQNWSCSVFDGKTPIGSGTGTGFCKANLVANLGYVYAQPLKVWNGSANKYYFYVEEWGAIEGPGSECWGDSILIFEAGYNDSGATGVTNPIYRGTANPSSQCSGSSSERSHWLFTSAVYDAGSVYLLGQRNKWNGTAFKDIWLGTSAPAVNGSYGKHFNWSKILQTTIAGHDLIGLYAVPDATGRIWRGVLENTHGGGWGATPVIINWNNNTIQYKTGPSTWATVAVGGSISGALPYLQQHGFVASFTKVNNRYELWYDTLPAPGGSQLPMVGCNTTLYNYNGSVLGRDDNGNQHKYVVMDTNLNAILGPLNHTSSTHPIPSSEVWSIHDPHSANVLGYAGSTMYYGSNDWSICNVQLNDWNPWSGMGIRWGRLSVTN